MDHHLAQGQFLLLVLDGDTVMAGELAEQLASHHVHTRLYSAAAEALLGAGGLHPDAVIVEAGLASMKSADVVRVLSARAGIPVVVGVGDDDGMAAAAALSAGAIACVARPYRSKEIIPLLRAIRPDTVGSLDPPIEVGDLRLDPTTLEAHIDGRLVPLPLKEFQLLRLFMINPDRILTREQILNAVWNGVAGDGSNTLSVHIKRLRQRLGTPAGTPPLIVTVRGLGYRLVPPHRSR